MRTRTAFIHGLNSSGRSFNYVTSQLGQENDIIVNYQSRQPLEDSVQQVLKALPKKEPVILVGHSLGGVIAVLIAGRKLANVEKVVTISSPIGGSKFAAWARWVVSGIPLLGDITPHSKHILEIQKMKLEMPALSIITTAGSLPTSTEPNDSVVSVASQKTLTGAKKVEISANHFEILLHEKLIEHLRKFIES